MSSVKKTIIAFLSCIALVFTGVAIASYVKVDAKGVFSSDKGITIQKDAVIDSSTGINDERKGLLLKGSLGASTQIVENGCGLFEIDFRVFSSNSFEEKGVPYGTKIDNPALETKEVKLLVENAENPSEFFEIVVSGASYDNFSTPSACVKVGDKKTAVYSYDTRTDLGNTTGANMAGFYTLLWNTSFTNTGYSNKSEQSAVTVSNVICFDPASMEVYGKSAFDSKNLIWDLSKSNFDGQTQKAFNSFKKYNVSFVFSDVANGKTGKAILYSVNGQSVYGDNCVDEIGPNVYADFKENAVIYKKFNLPDATEVSHYDVLGGGVDRIAVKCYVDGSETTVYDGNGQKTTNLTSGCYITPSKAGRLTISLTGYQGTLAGNEFKKNLTVFEEEPNVEYAIDEEIKNNYGKGTILTVAKAAVKSDLFIVEPIAKAKVYKDNAILSEYTSKQLPFDLKLADEGVYTIEYYCEESSQVKKYDISVSGEIPAFNLSGNIPADLSVGAELQLPIGVYEKDGKTYDAERTIIFPDKSVYSNDRIIFEKSGKYTVVYEAKIDGGRYSTEYDIFISDSFIPFTTSSGIVKPGEECPLLSEVKGTYLGGKDTTNVFTYSKILDLSAATKDDYLLRIYNAATGEWGKETTMSLPTIKLIDVYDPTNFINIDYKWGWHDYANTVYVNAPKQVPKAITDSGEIWTQNWGTSVYWFTGRKLKEVSMRSLCLGLCYDSEEKAIYRDPNWMIIDLDADYQEVQWRGFTTGEVYLQITNISEILVTEVYGNKLNDKNYVDDADPKILIDTSEYGEKDFDAIVGKAFPIFDAVANDNWSSQLDVDVKVFYNYGKSDYAELTVKDNAFVPLKEGKYTIVYSAVDEFGNKAKKTVDVLAKNSSEISPLRMQLDYYELPNGVVGQYYSIPTIKSISGGIGKTTATISVYAPSGMKAEIKNGSFLPTEDGYYIIEYYCKDYIGDGNPNEVIFEKSVYFSVGQEPILYDLYLPKVILSGATFKLPQIEVSDYFTSSDNSVKPTCSVTASINGNNVNVDENNNITPVYNGNGSADLIIKYTAENSKKRVEKEYVVKVVNAVKQEGFMADYFYDEKGGVTKTATSSGIELTATASDRSLWFINPVLANDFQIKMSIPDKNLNNTDMITVTLYDFENPRISLRFNIFRNTEDETSSSKSLLSINGGKKNEIYGNFYHPDATIGFVYRQSSLAVIDLTGNVIGYVNNTDGGDEFNGFPSMKVMVNVNLGNVSGSGLKAKVISLNNQIFSDLANDVIIPQFTLEKKVASLINANEDIKLPRVFAQDVLSPNSEVTITLNKVGGGVIFENETNVERSISFSEVGEYRLIYRVKDSAGKSFPQSYTIQVIEHEPPVITIEGNIDKAYSVNSAVNIPKISVTDNSGSYTVVKFIIKPNYDMKVLDGDVYTPTETGEYAIRYYVYDSSSNYSVKELRFSVR